MEAAVREIEARLMKAIAMAEVAEAAVAVERARAEAAERTLPLTP